VISSRWGGMAANIKETGNNQDVVYGAIYLISHRKLGVLTDYEHVKPVTVTVESQGTQILAQIYIFPKKGATGRPPDAYLNTMLEGLRQHGYKEDVIEKVRHIAQNP